MLTRQMAAWICAAALGIVALGGATQVAAFATHAPLVNKRSVASPRANPQFRIDPFLKVKTVRLHEKLEDKDEMYNSQTTVALVGGQTLFIAGAVILAVLFGTPNFGFGPGIEFSVSSLQLGTLLAVPLGVLACALDLIEDRYPALQDVTKATQRSVLALMGGTFKPGLAIGVAVALGLAAGFGEEMLFRGVVQYELSTRFGALAGVTAASIVFGALHAVTPLYALLAAVASVYFGALYLFTDNLAVPIACHTMYDIGALFYAHWTVSQLTLSELRALEAWQGPNSNKKIDIL